MTERAIGERAPEGCEACGGQDAEVRLHPNGGKYEACLDCHQDEVELAAIDTLARAA
ncbi:hypothetical protein MED01_007041 [Micromonospora sp. MED01]|uniref:hypothetical protein n=1 Tax=Micromonospora alfalfae TaxID=2911212 RepID=UPI001EE994E1|nr:hypothetical protein [Micromonospora alfalfae]MCG5462163.1 hypothetical protein [Micromonospora alfalfae]